MINQTDFMEQLNRYYAVWQEYNNAYEMWAKEHGLSSNSLLVLSAISEGEDDCTQKKISERWLIPKQTVNMILKDFEARGLVKLKPMSEDKRNKVIKLTAAGKRYADKIISELRKAELYAVEEMGIDRMKWFNNDMALFVEFFKKASGGKDEQTVKYKRIL